MDNSEKRAKKRNPVERANIISYLTFLYMFTIFKRGFKNGLTEDDLFQPLDEHKSSVLGEKLEAIWKEQHRKNGKFALYKALFKLFGFNFLMMGVVRLINEIVLVIAMPLAIGKLVAYFETGQTSISEIEVYICATIIVLCRLADPILSHGTMMGSMHISMKMRIACSALIYRKILRLKKTSLAGTTIGQLVNLLSKDVSRFDDGFLLANFAWIAPIQAVVGTYLLFNEIGVSAFYGMALLLSFIPLQTWLGKKNSTFTLKIALQTDKRVRLLNEVISGIHVIKMYCWEKPFEQLISLVRREEMKGIRYRCLLLGLIFCFEMFITRVSIFVSFLGYVLLGNLITARRMFAVTAIYAVLRPIITTIFSFGINSIAEVYVSVKRIQDFLSLEEQESHVQLNGFSEKISDKSRVLLKSVSARWLKSSLDPTLSDVNLDISSNQLVAVIGAVGSGKSSLINVLLKELPTENGTLWLSGEVSYAAQEPWLFNGSVRQNILFGNTYDKHRYKEVLAVCALESDLQNLPFGDRTLVGERGKSLSGGQKARINLARCVYKQADIYLLDDPLSAVDANVGRHLYEKCIKEFLSDKIRVLVTHQLQYLNNADKILVLEDGVIKCEGSFAELQSSGLDLTQMMAQLHPEEEIEDVTEKKPKLVELSSNEDLEALENDPLLEKESMETGSVKFSLYWMYFKAGGGLWNAVLMLTVFIGAQVVSSASDYFVTYWVNTEEVYKEKLQNLIDFNETFPRDTLLYVYSGIILVVFLFGIVHGIYFMLFFALASVTLHNVSFSRIMIATMKFFNNNPSGRILNRFSKDLGYIDEYIPVIMYDVIAAALDLFGAIILSVIVDFRLCVPSAVLLLIFYSFRKLYLQTSRSVKRIEGINRSPIYSHMSASIHGLSTIRAFSAQRLLIREFDEYQDKHSSAYYIFLASNRCFGFWIDATSAVFIAAAIFILLYFQQDLQGGDIGLVITQFIGLASGLQWGMRQWSEMENQMVSVERLIEYTQVETDPERKDSAVPQNWPENGRIQFCDVSLKYEESPVLKNLNFVIESREKIGIVGRTGAGKTSIITALFQLYPIGGKILIDNVNTTQIPLEALRSKISIIPQEPVLFSGSMRRNLDPFDEYNDAILWEALEQVEMKDVVSEMPDGLQYNVSEGGSNFSVGQRQLICLARALIRNNKILVMDEATANVDHYTDSLIQNTIREKFADCTVLTIAHRLHTVMDSDRILVMSAGNVEEFDHPHILLQNNKGVLYNLVQTTGKSTALNLEKVARESYMRKKQD